MQIRNNDNKLAAIFLTLLFPFGGLIYTLNNWRATWAKNTFWLACIFLGAVQIYCPAGEILGSGSDGGRYVLRLMAMYGSNITMKSILAQYLIDPNIMDLYFPLMSFLISRFTDNGHILFASFAIVFGYFYSRNIWYILERIPNKKLGYLIIFVILFFLVNPITHINGVRYNTAVHIFVYALLPFLLENDRSRIWWLIAVPFVHFSFLYVVILAAVYVLLPKSTRYNGRSFLTFSLIIFIASMFINSVNLSSVNSVLEEFSPEAYEERIDSYVNETTAANISEKAEALNWYVGASGVIKNWSYSILLVFLYGCFKRNPQVCNQFRNLYSFTLLFGAVANLMALVPSGGRFQLVAHMLYLALFLLVATRISAKDNFRGAVDYALIFLLIPMIVDIRRLFDCYSITAILGNFITVFFWENNVPLITFIKMIF